MLAALALVAAIGQPPAIPGEATSWIKQHAIPFTTAEAGNGFDDLRPLKAVIGDARIVSLGEPTHGTREAFQMKHRLMEFLATEMGFTIFSIEANMPESYDLNQYVIDGKGDPKKQIGGMYFWTWNTHEVLDMVEWMRKFNTAAAPKGAPTLQFTGFDMQTSEVAAKFVRDTLKAHLPDLAEEAAEVYQRVDRAKHAGGRAGFGVATGSFPVDAARGKKVTFSGWIRTEDLTEGYAGLWWRADGPEGVLAFDNMGGRGPSGTTQWARYEITLDVPNETKNINFGMLMPGDGAAWFDDIEIRLDGEVYAPKLSLDFEDATAPGFFTAPGSYAAGPSDKNPHGGAKCFEIRKNPAPAVEPADPGAAHADAEKIVATLMARRDELVRATSPKDADWVIQNARVVEQCARMFDGMAGGARGGSNIRDECMADNVAWILEHNPKSKIVLWAHNAHVSRGMMWGTQWMGSYLEKKFPGQMVVVGFATGVGAYTAVKQGAGLRQDNALAQPPIDSVESYLESAGVPRFLLDIRAAKPGDPGSGWLTTGRPMRGIGAMAMEEQFSPCTPKDLYDVLVYQDQTTAARQLDTKPGR